MAGLEFYSSCGNLCNDVLTKIDEDSWELVAPCISSITVIKATLSTSTAESITGQFCLYDCVVTVAGYQSPRVSRAAI